MVGSSKIIKMKCMTTKQKLAVHLSKNIKRNMSQRSNKQNTRRLQGVFREMTPSERLQFINLR